MSQTLLFEPAINKGADISECSRYRFTLWRIWDQSKPLAMIIGLNPSTADAVEDDRTIGRCVTFMRREGFGGFYMMNLFAFRATEPKDMKAELEPVGFMNNQWLRHISQDSERIIFAWGCDGGHMGRDKEVIQLFKDANPYCFGLTKEGYPKHPLFLSGDTPLIPFFNHANRNNDT